MRMTTLYCGLTCLLLVGCSDDADTPKNDGNSTQQTVGADGATVAIDSIDVEVPAGALSDGLELGVRFLEDLTASGYEALPDFLDSEAALSVELTPHGTTFDVPVTVSIDIPSGDGDWVVMRLDDENDTEWEPVGPVSVVDGTLVFETDRFSVYSAVQVAAGACPCWSGSDLDAIAVVAASRNKVLRWETENTHATDAVLPAGARFRISEARILSRYSTSPACAAVSSVALFPIYFPALAAVSSPNATSFIQALTPQQAWICTALRGRVSYSGLSAGVQVAFDTLNLPATETVEIELVGGGGVATVNQDQNLTWANVVLEPGDAYDFKIMTQPSSATCTLGSNAQGTAPASGNIVIGLTCIPNAPSTGCNVSIVGAGQVGSDSFSTECFIGSDAGRLLGVFWYDDAAWLMDPDFSVDLVASWSTFQGLNLGGFIFSESVSAGLGNGSGNEEGSVLATRTIGVWTHLTGVVWDITAFDQAAQTFSITYTSDVVGNSGWAVADPVNAEAIDYSMSGSATVTVTGNFLYLQ